MEKNDLLSIITPCLNRKQFVSEAVESVLNQDYSNIEHIIIDGGSSDGTLETLQRYEHLQVISEKDSGLYDAINKGLKLAKGEIIGFLNTDDYYEPNIFQRIIEAFTVHTTASAIVGAARIFVDSPKRSQEVIKVHPTISAGDLFYRSTRGNPIFNAWFFRKTLFNTIGEFTTHYKFVADREFLIRMYLRNQIYFSIPDLVYHYRAHPNSLTFTNRDMGDSELASEFLALDEYYIQLLGHDKPSKNICIHWHSELTSDQFISALKNKSPKRALIYSKSGLEYDIYWPIRLLQRIFTRLVAAINRRIL